uniref:Transmembrane protein n=1 Tax=Panagrolaimus superbus TaxID=310955 RepID=A0A914YNQ3_9BILA
MVAKKPEIKWNLNSSDSKVQTKDLKSDMEMEGRHQVVAGKKDDPKSGDEIVNKQRMKRKDASLAKKSSKSKSTNKKAKKQKTKKTKRKDKGKKKTASHAKSKTDKILHQLKPKIGGGDVDNDAHSHITTLKNRIIEANFDAAEILMIIELFFSFFCLIVSIILKALLFSALPIFLISVIAFLSTFPGALVFFKWKREHGIYLFSIGQLFCGFIELYWIAVVWYDFANYTPDVLKTTCILEFLVMYQFFATILTNWQPYRAKANSTKTKSSKV